MAEPNKAVLRASDMHKFQNLLWECVYKGNHVRLMKLTENISLNFPQIANPSGALTIEKCLRNCLQTLLYISWLEKTNKNKVIIAGELMIYIPESSNVIYWAVMDKSAEFKPGFLMSELVVMPKHSLVVKYILNKLIETENCNPLLDDSVSILHLIIVVGHMYEKFDESINLIAKYVVNNPAKVNFTCPWTGMSTLDLALERKLGFCSRMLYTMGCRANKMIGVEKYLAVKDVKVKVPSGESGDPLEGMCKYNTILDTWKKSEDSFIESMKLNIVGNESEGYDLESIIIKTTSEWIQHKLKSMQNIVPFKTQFEISGSLTEETKIRPLDEIDFVIKCHF